MGRICETTGKMPRGGGRKYVRSGLPKRKGGVGLKIRGKTLRWFKPNLQTIRVELPNGAVRKMTLAVSVIKKGVIKVKIDGKMQKVPLRKAARGRQTMWRKEQAEAEASASSQ